MRHRKVTAELAEQWRTYAECALGSGESMRQITESLAASAGCDPSTVWRYIDSEYAAMQRLSDRRCYQRRAARLEKKRTYERNYRRLTRTESQTKVFSTVFKDARDVDLSIEEIGTRLAAALDGVRFGSRLIESVIDRYIRSGRGPPYLEQDNRGHYRMRFER